MAYKFMTIVTDPPQYDNTLRLISPIPLSCGASPLREALDERRRQDHLQGPHLLGNRVTSLRARRSVLPELFSPPRNSTGSPAGQWPIGSPCGPPVATRWDPTSAMKRDGSSGVTVRARAQDPTARASQQPASGCREFPVDDRPP